MFHEDMETNILFPKPPKIIKKDTDRAIFEIENCYPGYGMTLGNAFRRVLLSSLPGTAITAVRIKGVDHEFSTIPHVLEDAIQIILNLKQIRFKLHSEEPVTLTLKIKGEKEVKASDIKLTSDVEIVNKNTHIATLTDKKAELEMEIEVDSGLGYVTAEQRKKEKLPVGYIAIDAVYSPLKRANYEVENMRVGDRTDFNRLKIDIETDGSIAPEEAFQKAARILVDHFSVFVEKEKAEKERKSPSVSKKKTAKEPKKSGGKTSTTKTSTAKSKKSQAKTKSKTKKKK